MRDVFFEGIAPPARFDAAEGVLALLPQVVFGWPFVTKPADTSLVPFYTVSADATEGRYACQAHVWNGPLRRLDGLNAVCDLVAAMAHALPDWDPTVLCLHAAAVRISGRLVVFPNTRRAGKSTLSVALAMAGHQLVGDDVVPISFLADGHAMAHALGAAPRLRLPLPVSAPEELRQSLDRSEGIRNQLYRYVRLPDQPKRGQQFPVDSIVILDRRDDPVAAEILPVAADSAMDALLFQNFARSRHSGEVLEKVAGLLEKLPIFSLRYHDLQGAMDCLEKAFHSKDVEGAAAQQNAAWRFQLADFRRRRGPSVVPNGRLQQRPATQARVIGETLYLADVEGRAIHRADPLAAVIWDLLAEPTPPAEIEKILVSAFPQAAAKTIIHDLGILLKNWARAGLIEAI